LEALAQGRLFRAQVGVAAVFFLNGFGYGSWVPRIAELQAKLGLSAGQLGLALFMAAVGALLAMPLAGAAAHRHGSRAATAVTAVAFGLCLPGIAFAPGPLWLGGALFFVGASVAALDVSMNAQGVAVERHRWRPIMSSLHGMFSLGAMAGAGATGLIATAGIGLLPHLLGLGGSIAIAGLIACLPMLPARAEHGPAGPGLVRPALAILGPGIVALACLLSEGAIADWSAVYLSASLAAGTTMAAAAFAAFSVMMAAGRFTGDPLVARLGGDLVVRAGGALAATGLDLTLVIGDPPFAIVGFGLVGAGLSSVFPVVLSSAARTPGDGAERRDRRGLHGRISGVSGRPAFDRRPRRAVRAAGRARPRGPAVRARRGARQPVAGSARRRAENQTPIEQRAIGNPIVM
jgi:MFS family permease